MSQTIERTVRVDDRDINIKSVLHQDPSVHAEHIEDIIKKSVVVEDGFHATVVLIK